MDGDAGGSLRASRVPAAALIAINNLRDARTDAEVKTNVTGRVRRDVRAVGDHGVGVRAVRAQRVLGGDADADATMPRRIALRRGGAHVRDGAVRRARREARVDVRRGVAGV